MNKNLPTALVAADVCIFKIIDGELCVYVTKVKHNDAYIGMNCLPGSLIRLHENAEDTIKRVLEERTNITNKNVYLEQLYSFSEVRRDKRSRSVSIAYLGLVEAGLGYCDEENDKGGFVPIRQAKNLAFDHKEIIMLGVHRLKGKLHYSTIVKKLIHGPFTFAELQKVYEIVLGENLDKRNFRKKMASLDLLKETGDYKKEGRMRPAMLYMWRTNKIGHFDMFGAITAQ